MSKLATALKNKIARREAKICVIGLGYVGLPLAVEFAKAGFTVTGFDLDKEKIVGDKEAQKKLTELPYRGDWKI